MLIDHTAHALVVPYPMGNYMLYCVMRFIGRMTAPVMFFFIAEGYHHTRDKNKYTLRLAVFAAISYIPFVGFMTGGLPNGETFFKLNVIYTLFIGFLALRAWHEIEAPLVKALAILGLTLLSLPGDWTYMAVYYILAFDYYRGNFRKQAVAYLFITLLTCVPEYANLIYTLVAGKYLDGNTLAVTLINLGRYLPIGLLYFYNGKKGAGGKLAQWGFYIFYPLHLTVLWALAKGIA